jgi:exopolyphosphatase / guanosine-5'-triphosphate,3'-diphosphate pyrophosphatase
MPAMAARQRKIAAIDVGTNSIHMIIVECRARSCRVIDKEKEMVLLGEGSLGGEPLTDEAIGRGVDAIRRMVEIARRWEVDHIEAVATSAVREAPNRRRFAREVEKVAGIPLRIITGHEEADLIFRAVRSAVDFQGETALCIDIGGGSLELIAGSREEIHYATSEPLGALRLTEKFFENDPPTADEIRACRKHVRKLLKKPVAAVRAGGFGFCIGTSGTITTLAELASESGDTDRVVAGMRWLGRARLEELTEAIALLSADERAKTLNLVPKRAQTILAGAIALDEFMRLARVGRLRACNAALREGIIEKALEESVSPRVQADSGGSVRRTSILDLARRSDADLDHATQVARLATRIFDQTRPLHELDDGSRELIEYAALLHEIGLHVSWKGHHKHAYYVIRHAELRGFTQEQVDVIANLARYHRKAKPSTKHESFADLGEKQQLVVERGTAILRLANALDRGRNHAIRDVEIALDNGSASFTLRTKGDASLELEAGRKNAKHFRKVFDVDTAIEMLPGSRK